MPELHQNNTNRRGRAFVATITENVNIRQVIKAQLFADVDFEVVSEMPTEDLIEQVTFVVEELGRRNWFIIDRDEIDDLAETLAGDLLKASRERISLQ